MAGKLELPGQLVPYRVLELGSHLSLAPGPHGPARDDSFPALSQCDDRSVLVTPLDFWKSEISSLFIF